jgi:hypothetical protein
MKYNICTSVTEVYSTFISICPLSKVALQKNETHCFNLLGKARVSCLGDFTL